MSKRRLFQMLKLLTTTIKNCDKVKVITRPETDFKGKDKDVLKEMYESIRTSGAELIFKANIHQKFAIIDKRTVWYGSINLLSYGSSE
ncbi:phospholipase D-like domain-containing protein [Clostridium thailandense]|uniref:phospholipase D-like domain-containing protein n=1 Tax=Clostridium thailandense TaxID=2794346 RepID=UPI0028AB95E1|nr:phospholipase D-like domain-containing protein [Clostridium thailandense]